MTPYTATHWTSQGQNDPEVHLIIIICMCYDSFVCVLRHIIHAVVDNKPIKVCWIIVTYCFSLSGTKISKLPIVHHTVCQGPIPILC